MQPLPQDGAACAFTPPSSTQNELVLRQGLPARRPLLYIEAYVLWLALRKQRLRPRHGYTSALCLSGQVGLLRRLDGVQSTVTFTVSHSNERFV